MSALDNLPFFGKTEINLPAWYVVPYLKEHGTSADGKTKRYIQMFSLASPMTTSRNLSNRRKGLSVNIRRKAGIGEPEVDNSWDDSSASHKLRDVMTLNRFDKLDQDRIKKMEEHDGEIYTNYPVLARGRPEVMGKNVEYNRHHKKHNLEQKYGIPFLRKVKETELGRPHRTYDNDDDDESTVASPVSSRTGSSRAGSKTPSRLSSLTSSLRSSSRGSYGGFDPANQSEEDDDEDDEDDEDEDEEAERQAEKQAEKNRRRGLFGRNPLGSSSSGSSSGSSSSGSSSGSSSHRPSVSRGKPPLKRKEPDLAKTSKAIERAEAKRKKDEAMAEKKRAKAEAKEAKAKATQEAKEAKAKEKADKPKTKTKTTKPTPSEAGEEITKKARGRTPKYATKEEQYKAKLESNKLGKQRKAEALKKAKAEKAEAGEASPPKAKGKKKQNVELVIEE